MRAVERAQVPGGCETVEVVGMHVREEEEGDAARGGEAEIIHRNGGEVKTPH